MHAYVDTKTNTYHRIYCDCVKHIKPSNLIEMRENIASFYTLGYKPCECCSPLLKQFKKEEKDIRLFCLNNAIHIKFVDESLIIDTFYSSWKLIYAIRTGGTLVLYHENNQIYNKYNSVKGNIIKEYHNQKVEYNSIMDYLKYIVAHDEYKSDKSTSYKKYNKTSRTKRYLRNRAKMKDYARKTNRVLNIIEELEAQNVAAE